MRINAIKGYNFNYYNNNIHINNSKPIKNNTLRYDTVSFQKSRNDSKNSFQNSFGIEAQKGKLIGENMLNNTNGYDLDLDYFERLLNGNCDSEITFVNQQSAYKNNLYFPGKAISALDTESDENLKPKKANIYVCDDDFYSITKKEHILISDLVYDYVTLLQKENDSDFHGLKNYVQINGQNPDIKTIKVISQSADKIIDETMKTTFNYLYKSFDEEQKAKNDALEDKFNPKKYAKISHLKNNIKELSKFLSITGMADKQDAKNMLTLWLKKEMQNQIQAYEASVLMLDKDSKNDYEIEYKADRIILKELLSEFYSFI